MATMAENLYKCPQCRTVGHVIEQHPEEENVWRAYCTMMDCDMEVRGATRKEVVLFWNLVSIHSSIGAVFNCLECNGTGHLIDDKIMGPELEECDCWTELKEARS